MLVADDVISPLAVMSVKHKPSMKSIEKSKRDETRRQDTKETKCFYRQKKGYSIKDSRKKLNPYENQMDISENVSAFIAYIEKKGRNRKPASAY